MGTKSRELWLERSLQKNNTGSYSVSLPVDLIRALNWQKGQRVRLAKKGSALVIKDVP
ncbi:MAG TPA: AbrB/MazE/SpoVT family DNA-binding domain-containing protein [Candidatus Saccharimonadales bacterium]